MRGAVFTKAKQMNCFANINWSNWKLKIKHFKILTLKQILAKSKCLFSKSNELFHMRVSEHRVRQSFQGSRVENVLPTGGKKNQENFTSIAAIVPFKPAFKREFRRIPVIKN